MDLPIELCGYIAGFMSQSDIKKLILVSYLTKNEALKNQLIYVYTANLNTISPLLVTLFNTLKNIANINTYMDYISIKQNIFNVAMYETYRNRIIIAKYVKHYSNHIQPSKERIKFTNICYHITNLCIENNVLEKFNTITYF